MASFRKDKARKPLVADGTCYTGTHVEWAPPEGGFVRAVGTNYTLNVVPPNREQRGYAVHLSEDEMLQTVSEWLATFNRARKKADAKS